MSTLHRALVVEDESDATNDLVEILKACGCECEVATNGCDALQALERSQFCIILLDLQIKAEAGSILGHTEHGNVFLREARARNVQHDGTSYLLPIVVVSGYASEVDAAVAAMRDGASDVIQKLSSGRDKSEKIRRALELAGRTSHEACGKLSAVTPATKLSDVLILDIPAEVDGQRVVVRLGGRQAKLTHAALKVLLHLVKGRLSSTRVHKVDLGARADRGFRGVSVLRQELAFAYDGDSKDIVINDQRGCYYLSDKVAVGQVDTAMLERLGDGQVAKLAREIRHLSRMLKESAGKDTEFPTHLRR
jgi:CheY-like chemotaxis protein